MEANLVKAKKLKYIVDFSGKLEHHHIVLNDKSKPEPVIESKTKISKKVQAVVMI